ncbi:MAG: EscN/YscN/HrcN family type III secretion system ATPase, partial [Thermomicrobiales bacterium]
MPTLNLDRYHRALREVPIARREGRVREAVGIALEAEGLDVSIGELCHIHPRRRQTGRASEGIPAEVVGFHGERFVLVPLTDVHGIGPDSRVTATGRSFRVPVGDAMLGRVLDGLGRPIDGRGPLRVDHTYEPAMHPPSPLGRQPISKQMPTGVRSIDTAIACAEGQRMGIFAGSGVGKSTLIGMICRNIEADIRVIALIGERGREVRNFIENDLGPEGLARSVVIVSTSDQPAMLRLKAAWVA